MAASGRNPSLDPDGRMRLLVERVGEALELADEEQHAAFQRLRAEFPDHDTLVARMERAAAALPSGPSFVAMVTDPQTGAPNMELLPAEGRESEGDPEIHEDPKRTPDRVGPFRILHLLGRGGMGAVYLAEDERLGRRVALKMLSHGLLLTSPKDSLARFQREAEAVSKLDHPGICAIFDAGEFDGVPYIAMRYVEGESLAQRLDALESGSSGLDADVATAPSSREEVHRVLVLIERVARALHHAHEAGLVHRDVKPANIMLTAEHTPVLLDFGLAREELHGQEALTHSGALLGTPAYMSPEQLVAQRIPLDRRTDVYSLGVTLYECLTLRRPFSEPTRERLYQRILVSEPLPVRHRNPRLSRDLAVVVATAMEKDRERRYQSALDFAEDLRRLRELQPIRARPIGIGLRIRRWIQRNRAAAMALAVVMVSIAGTILGLSIALDRTRAAETLAKKRLSEILRLSDLEAVRALEVESRELWPRRPIMIPRFRDWLARANTLLDRRGQHEADLRRFTHEELRRQIDVDILPATAEAPDWSRATQEVRWQVTTGKNLVERLLALAASDVAERLAFAERLEKGEAGWDAKWSAAIADISRREIYVPLAEIKAQPGLVPLRRDPASGLWEFWHVGSGRQPELRADGVQWNMTGDTGIVLVLLPGGPFTCRRQTRGSWAGAFSGTLAPFFLSKYEMTQGQWERIVGRNPSLKPQPSHPVNSVSWFDCEDCLDKLGLVIPTEAQWEYACRSGANTRFATGDGLETLTGHINAQGREDGYVSTAPVGALLPNGFGLYNMNGNMIEWCRDRDGREAARVEPRDMYRSRSTAPDARRITRGGHYSAAQHWAACSNVTSTRPVTALWWLGVRPALML